ncbi:MAG: hypothetical protein BWY66_00862 [bacterium ADurb.Bin374]|nr:MAG: hypothetical protein BWY66_00862 [bacterium ADurb.Bin374]
MSRRGKADVPAGCAFCASVRWSVVIDREKEEQIPLEAGRFRPMTKEGGIRQCPSCGTYYRYSKITDNEPGNEQHTEEFVKLSTAVAEAEIALERDREAHFKEVLGKRYAEQLGTLGDDERRLWEHFVVHRSEIIPLFDLKARFQEFPDVERMLDSLVAAGLVQRTVTPSVWQETTPVIRDWNIRYQITCPTLDLLEIGRDFETSRKPEKTRIRRKSPRR